MVQNDMAYFGHQVSSTVWFDKCECTLNGMADMYISYMGPEWKADRLVKTHHCEQQTVLQ